MKDSKADNAYMRPMPQVSNHMVHSLLSWGRLHFSAQDSKLRRIHYLEALRSIWLSIVENSVFDFEVPLGYVPTIQGEETTRQWMADWGVAVEAYTYTFRKVATDSKVQYRGNAWWNEKSSMESLARRMSPTSKWNGLLTNHGILGQLTIYSIG